MNILKIIKINFLALMALPLLILSTFIKLLAKAMEKALIILRVFVLICGIVLAFEIVKNPNQVMEAVGYFLAFFIFFGIFAIIALAIIKLISSAIMATVNIFIRAMNTVYKCVYAGYTTLYRICYMDYCMLDIQPSAKRGMCFAYMLLWILNRLVVFFAIHALKIMIVCNIGVIFYYAVSVIRYVYSEFNMNLFQYLKVYSSFDVIGEFILELIVLAGVSTVLISLGNEWSEWGKEMCLSISDYETYVENIREWNTIMEQNGVLEYEGIGRNETDNNNYYLNILTEHVRTFESFIQYMRAAAEQGGNDVLRADYTQYVSDVNNLAQLAINHGGQIPAEVFENMIPIIKRIDAAKKRIEQQAEQIMKVAKNKQDGGFFKGCDTKEKLEKRYKALCKTYHPDSESGDEDTFKRMSDEYEMRKKNFT